MLMLCEKPILIELPALKEKLLIKINSPLCGYRRGTVLAECKIVTDDHRKIFFAKLFNTGQIFGLYRDLEFRILSTLGALKNHLRRLETSYIQNNRTRNDTPDTIPRNLVVSLGFGNARKSNFLKVKDEFQNFNN